MTVQRRVVGTVDQVPQLHCHYVARVDDQGPPFAADFTAAEVITAAEGSPDDTTFQAVIAAIQAHGRALGGTDGSHDEHAEMVTSDGVTVSVSYRDIPPVGSATPPVFFVIANVLLDVGAPSELAFSSVLWAFAAFGDLASGFGS